jgi:hypothetical protein
MLQENANEESLSLKSQKKGKLTHSSVLQLKCHPVTGLGARKQLKFDVLEASE